MTHKPSWKGGVVDMNPTTSWKVVVDRQNHLHTLSKNNRATYPLLVSCMSQFSFNILYLMKDKLHLIQYKYNTKKQSEKTKQPMSNNLSIFSF